MLHAVSPGGPLEHNTLLLAQAIKPPEPGTLHAVSPGGPPDPLPLAQAGCPVQLYAACH